MNGLRSPAPSQRSNKIYEPLCEALATVAVKKKVILFCPRLGALLVFAGPLAYINLCEST